MIYTYPMYAKGVIILDKIYIYADGGCRGNQFKENIGGYGVLLQYKTNAKELKGATRNTTNNIMELTACIEGMKAITDKSIPTEVVMDSNYVITGINSWIYGWLKKEWRNSQGNLVENKELWQQLYALKNEFKDITFIKCKGHSNNEGNNRADKLANEAMDTLR